MTVSADHGLIGHQRIDDRFFYGLHGRLKNWVEPIVWNRLHEMRRLRGISRAGICGREGEKKIA